MKKEETCFLFFKIFPDYIYQGRGNLTVTPYLIKAINRIETRIAKGAMIMDEGSSLILIFFIFLNILPSGFKCFQVYYIL
jgi:hypothetical protein